MTRTYGLEIEDRLKLNATPVAVKTLSFDTPRQIIACVLSEPCSVILLHAATKTFTGRIPISADPIDITGGGRDLAYVACRASRTVDVFHSSGFLKRIEVPGEPQGIAWNGNYHPNKRKILVTCAMPEPQDGVVCVIDEDELAISNTVKVGKQPRGISLGSRRKHLWVANYGSDSVTVIDQDGSKALATLPTAGRPCMVNTAWSAPNDVLVSLSTAGILQRMDASEFPPVLSGITALRRPTNPPNSLSPVCAIPMNEDHLWLVPDRYSETLALVRADEHTLEQIDVYTLGSAPPGEVGLGPVSVFAHGLPSGVCIANRKSRQLIFAKLHKL